MKKKLMQKNLQSIILASKKNQFVSERILKAFRDARNRMQRGVFYYKAQKKKIKTQNKTKQNKSSHKQWLEQADDTNAQALVWCPGEKANAATVSQHAISTCCSTDS